MNTAGSIPLYPFMKVGFITGLAPGTYRCSSSSPTETVTAFLHSPADSPPPLPFPCR